MRCCRKAARALGLTSVDDVQRKMRCAAVFESDAGAATFQVARAVDGHPQHLENPACHTGFSIQSTFRKAWVAPPPSPSPAPRIIGP